MFSSMSSHSCFRKLVLRISIYHGIAIQKGINHRISLKGLAKGNASWFVASTKNNLVIIFKKFKCYIKVFTKI